jgi:hypothetical protein
MSPSLRAAVLVTATLLWLSGALWMALHYFVPGHNEFGPLPNPYEAPLLWLHGLTAVVGVFLFGWLGASHMLVRWPAAGDRPSGLVLFGCAIVLVLSGYALYYTTGALHEGAGLIHQWLGLAALGVALTHWLKARAAPVRSQRPAPSTTSSGSLTK